MKYQAKLKPGQTISQITYDGDPMLLDHIERILTVFFQRDGRFQSNQITPLTIRFTKAIVTRLNKEGPIDCEAAQNYMLPTKISGKKNRLNATTPTALVALKMSVENEIRALALGDVLHQLIIDTTKKTIMHLAPRLDSQRATSDTDTEVLELGRELGWVMVRSLSIRPDLIPFLNDCPLFLREKIITSDHYHDYTLAG